MESIQKLANQLADECEKMGVPMLLGFGTDKIIVVEYAPDNTPERLTKARSTLINTTRQARRQMEIQA